MTGGDGMGRSAGQVVFVPETAPGDLVLVETVEGRGDYLRARVVEIRESSPARRQPPCPLYSTCGGCSLMHLSVEAQAEAKRGILLDVLRRIGGLEMPQEPVFRGGPEFGYRTRARFHVKVTNRGPLVGFHERGSHRIADVGRCLQISEPANLVLEHVRQWLDSRPVRASGLVSVELVEPSSSAGAGRPVLRFFVQGRWLVSRLELEELFREAGLAGLVVNRAAGPARGGLRLGRAELMHRVGDLTYRTRPGSFFQSNRFLVEALVDEVVPPGRAAGSLAVDLHCGVGLFTLPLARRYGRVIGVELSAAAVADARANARRAGLDNVEIRCGSASDFATGEGFRDASLVVVDPPRGGLEPPVIDGLVAARPAEIGYVSCDPAALARDLGNLVRKGFEVSRLVVLDLFPNTHHLEAVAVMRPRTAQGATG